MLLIKGHIKMAKQNSTTCSFCGAKSSPDKIMFNGDLLIIPDIRFDYNEPRYIGFGYVKGRLMSVIYTERMPDVIRIISFRKANNREQRNYEKHKNRLG